MALNLQPFTTPEHQPYHWTGTNGCAALLVHGFPGTPVELRTVGKWLHAAGWDVRGVLLPGFGAGMGSMGSCTHRDWADAVLLSLRELRHAERLLIVGNSMGSALALHAAARSAVDGLILFSPFWRINSLTIDRAFALLQPFVPKLHPFQWFDPDDPRLRDGIRRSMPDADLDDPLAQETLRSYVFPTSVLKEVRQVGRLGYASLPHVSAPVAFVQGTEDWLAHPSLTRRMARRLPVQPWYVEVRSGHEVAHMREPHEHALAPLVQTFAALIRDRPPARGSATQRPLWEARP